MNIINSFNTNNFEKLCRQLAKKDIHLKSIIDRYGYPPLWSRSPGFETLVHIILEQQVSLASAKAAYIKLQEKTGTITPEKIIALSSEELKACYFSRQKMIYVKDLAQKILDHSLPIQHLHTYPDEEIHRLLKNVKGIGNWTADVFLMMCLHRCDCFPAGDIALIKSVKENMQLPADTSIENILLIAEKWKPYRTIAAFILWHAYIKKRNMKVDGYE